MAEKGTLVQNLAEALIDEFNESDVFDLSDNETLKETIDLLYECLDNAIDTKKIVEDISENTANKSDKTKDELLKAIKESEEKHKQELNKLSKLIKSYMKKGSKKQGGKEPSNDDAQGEEGDTNNESPNNNTPEETEKTTSDELKDKLKTGKENEEGAENSDDFNAEVKSYDILLRNTAQAAYETLRDTRAIRKKLGIEYKKEEKEEKKQNKLLKWMKKSEKKQERRSHNMKIDLKRSIKQSAAKTWARLKKLLIVGAVFFLLPTITQVLKNSVKATESIWKPVADWLKNNFPSLYESLKKIAHAVELLAEFIIDMKRLIDWVDENASAISMAGMAGTLGIAGAKIGMRLGPIGAIVGALLGAGIGALVGKFLSSDDEENPYEINKRQSKKYGAQLVNLERGVAITTAETSRENFLASDKAYKDLLQEAKEGKVTDAELELAARKRIFDAYNYDIVRKGVLQRSDLTGEERKKMEEQSAIDTSLASDLFDISGGINENAIKFTNKDSKIIMNVTNFNNTKVAQFIQEDAAQ